MIRRVSSVLVLLGAAVVVAAPPTSADSTSSITISGITRGYSEFDSNNPSYDEVMWVGDQHEDGWGVVAYWRRGAQGGACVNESGNNTRALCNQGIAFAENLSFLHYGCSKDGPFPSNFVIKGCGIEKSDRT